MKSETECSSRPPSLNSLTCSLAPHRRSRGSQRTPRDMSPQAPGHVLPPGEELQGCSLSKSLKALKGQRCHTHIVPLPTARCEHSQYLLQFPPPPGNREFTFCQPMPEQEGSHNPDQIFPISRHPSLTWEELFGVYQSTSSRTIEIESPLCHCALGTERTGWVQALTVRFFCVELEWGFRSFRGCHSSISIIFLLISRSLKYNQVYSYSWHMNSEQFV